MGKCCPAPKCKGPGGGGNRGNPILPAACFVLPERDSGDRKLPTVPIGGPGGGGNRPVKPLPPIKIPPRIDPPPKRRRGGPTTPDPGGGWKRGLPPGFSFKHGGQFTGPPTKPTPECRCAYTGGPYSDPRMPPIEDRETGCTTSWLFFTYECEPASPGPTPPDPVDALVATARARGDTVSVQRGTTTCKGTEKGCEGECSDTGVTIISCPRGPIKPRPLPPQEPDIRVQLPKKIIPPVLVQTKSIFTLDPSEPPTTPDLVDPFDPPSPPVVVETNTLDPFDPPSPPIGTQSKPGNVPTMDISNSKELVPRTFFPPANTPPEDLGELQVLKPQEVTSYGNNTPEGYAIKRTKEEPELTIDPTTIPPKNLDNELYVKDKVLEIPYYDSILKYAHNTARIGGTLNLFNLFSSTVPKWLSDLLSTKGGKVFKPYSGTTIGANLFQTKVLENSFSRETSEFLNQIDNLNNTSLYLKDYLLTGIRKAINNGQIESYTPEWLLEIINASKSNYPTGTPKFSLNNLSGKKELAYELVRNKRISINPQQYSNGDDQRIVQRYRVLLPTDELGMRIPVITQDGEETFLATTNLGVPVIKQDGEVVTPELENEFVKVINRTGELVGVAAASLRDIAYVYDIPTLNKIYGLLNNTAGEEGGKEFYHDLTFSSLYADNAEKDLTATGDHPQFSLWGVIPSSIQKTASPQEYLKSHSTKYELVWSSTDTDMSAFTEQVKLYSGPRFAHCIPKKDPITNHIFNVDAADGKFYAQVTTHSLDIPLDGKVYPSPIPTDFMIYLTTAPEYNVLQGESTLDTFTPEEEVKRSIRMLLNPFSPQPEISKYVTPVKSPTGRGVGEEKDEYGFQYAGDLQQGTITSSVDKGDYSVTATRSSILGTVLSLIDRIDTYYDLSTPNVGSGKMLPQLDLYSFLTVNQVIEFISSVPPSVIKEIFNGNLTGIEIFNPLRKPRFGDPTEETYITASRQKGATDLSTEQLFTHLPQDLNYYNTLVEQNF